MASCRLRASNKSLKPTSPAFGLRGGLAQPLGRSPQPSLGLGRAELRNRAPNERRPTAKGQAAAEASSRWHDIQQAIDELRNGTTAAIERRLGFLEEDPNFHRSGYLRETIWRRFMHLDAPAKQLRRLEDVALAYLGRRMTREFWYMARTMSERGSYGFWRRFRPWGSDARLPQQVQFLWDFTCLCWNVGI